VAAAWATFLGASEGLLSFHLEAYTSAVPGAPPLRSWPRSRPAGGSLASRSHLGRGSPARGRGHPLEAGVRSGRDERAGVRRVAGRPTRAFAIAAVIVAAAAALIIGWRASPATLHAWWRGYSGYDLIAVGQVRWRILRACSARCSLRDSRSLLVVQRRALGALAVVAIFVVHRMWTGTSVFLLELASAVAASVWVGVIPALLWLACQGEVRGSRSRSGSSAPTGSP